MRGRWRCEREKEGCWVGRAGCMVSCDTGRRQVRVRVRPYASEIPNERRLEHIMHARSRQPASRVFEQVDISLSSPPAVFALVSLNAPSTPSAHPRHTPPPQSPSLGELIAFMSMYP